MYKSICNVRLKTMQRKWNQRNRPLISDMLDDDLAPTFDWMQNRRQTMMKIQFIIVFVSNDQNRPRITNHLVELNYVGCRIYHGMGMELSFFLFHRAIGGIEDLILKSNESFEWINLATNDFSYFENFEKRQLFNSFFNLGLRSA